MREIDPRNADDAAEVLGTFTNVMGHNTDRFVRTILSMHRTLQQNVFGLMLACIKAWAELEPNRYDARNAFTVEKSKEIVELLGKYNLRPPMI